ncbi:MAG: HTH domain-containing protein [Treponema sp.]|jgi:predicted ArsR family transcriptional regulator|nr:HTH domain-containing protein [Treponema sp.]
MMKRTIGGVAHEAIVEFLEKQGAPVPIGEIARAFGISRNAVLVRMATLTFAKRRIAEDDQGRVYLKKEDTRND